MILFCLKVLNPGGLLYGYLGAKKVEIVFTNLIRGDMTLYEKVLGNKNHHQRKKEYQFQQFNLKQSQMKITIKERKKERRNSSIAATDQRSEMK